MIRRIIVTIAATAELRQKPNRAIERVTLENGTSGGFRHERPFIQRNQSAVSEGDQNVTQTILDESCRVCGCHQNRWKQENRKLAGRLPPFRLPALNNGLS